MVQTILSRLATSLLVIFGASVLVYCIMYLLPGDPVLLMLDPSSATPEMIEKSAGSAWTGSTVLHPVCELFR